MNLVRSAAPAGTDQYEELLAWVGSVCTPDTVLLDIGAGDGDAVYHERLRGLAPRIVGVDPDPGVLGNPHLDEAHQATLQEYLAADPHRVAGADVAVAVYVVEHVEDPAGFLGAAQRLLRPGGSLFLLTPNLWHYFGLAAKAGMRLGVEDRVLHGLRGHETVEHYHFPVAYRLNSVGAMRRAAAAAGFRRLEIRHLEDPGIFQPYFPGRSQVLPVWWSAAVRRCRLRGLYGTLLARLVR